MLNRRRFGEKFFYSARVQLRTDGSLPNGFELANFSIAIGPETYAGEAIARGVGDATVLIDPGGDSPFALLESIKTDRMQTIWSALPGRFRLGGPPRLRRYL